MRKLLILLLCISNLPLVSFCAVNAGMHWNVQTGGASTNGGGFDSTVGSPGTDASQGAGQAYTDIVIGGTTTQATSAAHPFTSTTFGPGNVIKITGGAGCTTGWHEMLSQSGGTATFAESLGTAASTCSGTLGGPLTLAAALVSGPSVNGNTIDVKSGTYTLAAALSMDPQSGSATGTLLLWGYGSTPGDNGTRPLITTATNSTVLLRVSSPSVFTFRNINFSNTASTRADCINSWSNSAALFIGENLTFDGCGSTTGAAINGDNGVGDAMAVVLYNSEIKNGSQDGVRCYQVCTFYGDWIHANTGIGISRYGGGSDGISIANTAVQSNAGGGVAVNNAVCTLNITNSDILNNTGPGISPGGSWMMLSNNIIYGNSTYGIANFLGSGASLMEVNNAFGSNTTANRQYTPTVGVVRNDLTLTAAPYTSVSNLLLNSTAGGGAVLLKTAFPGAAPFGTGFLDIGAVQTSGGTGGGGSTSAFSN